MAVPEVMFGCKIPSSNSQKFTHAVNLKTGSIQKPLAEVYWSLLIRNHYQKPLFYENIQMSNSLKTRLLSRLVLTYHLVLLNRIILTYVRNVPNEKLRDDKRLIL